MTHLLPVTHLPHQRHVGTARELRTRPGPETQQPGGAEGVLDHVSERRWRVGSASAAPTATFAQAFWPRGCGLGAPGGIGAQSPAPYTASAFHRAHYYSAPVISTWAVHVISTWVVHVISTWVVQVINTWVVHVIRTWVVYVIRMWVVHVINTCVVLGFSQSAQTILGSRPPAWPW